LEAFSTYRRLLNDDLGLDPSPALRAQQAAILQGSAELDGPVPTPETFDEGASASLVGDQDQGEVHAPGLPAEDTSFFGRTDDIVAAAATIGQARLVTLTGVGGAIPCEGKTFGGGDTYLM
jgi:hypothetical protein